eukprot:ANDGO_02373.mRNA.1 hypothetical protein
MTDRNPPSSLSTLLDSLSMMDAVSSPGYSSSLSQLSRMVGSPLAMPRSTKPSTPLSSSSSPRVPSSMYKSSESEANGFSRHGYPGSSFPSDDVDKLLWSARLRPVDESSFSPSRGHRTASLICPEEGREEREEGSSFQADRHLAARQKNVYSYSLDSEDVSCQTETFSVSGKKPWILLDTMENVIAGISSKRTIQRRSVETNHSVSEVAEPILIVDNSNVVEPSLTPSSRKGSLASVGSAKQQSKKNDLTALKRTTSDKKLIVMIPTTEHSKEDACEQQQQQQHQQHPHLQHQVPVRVAVDSFARECEVHDEESFWVLKRNFERELYEARSYCSFLEGTLVTLGSSARSVISGIRDELRALRSMRMPTSDSFKDSLIGINDMIQSLVEQNAELRERLSLVNERDVVITEQLEQDVAYWTNQYDALQSNAESREKELQREIRSLEERIQLLESKEKMVAERARQAAEADILVLKLRADWRDMRQRFISDFRDVNSSLTGLDKAFSRNDCTVFDSVVRSCLKTEALSTLVRDAVSQTVNFNDRGGDADGSEEDLAIGDETLPEYEKLFAEVIPANAVSQLRDQWSVFRPVMADTLLVIDSLRPMRDVFATDEQAVTGMKTPDVGSDLESFEIRLKGQDSDDTASDASADDADEARFFDTEGYDESVSPKEPPDEFLQIDEQKAESHPKVEASGDQTIAPSPEADQLSDEKIVTDSAGSAAAQEDSPPALAPVPEPEVEQAPEEVDPEFLEFLGADADDLSYQMLVPREVAKSQAHPNAQTVSASPSTPERGAPTSERGAPTPVPDENTRSNTPIAIALENTDHDGSGFGESVGSDAVSPLSARNRADSMFSQESTTGSSFAMTPSAAAASSKRGLVRHTSYALSAVSAKFRAILRFQQQLEAGIVAEKHCRNAEPHKINMMLVKQDDYNLSLKYPSSKKVTEVIHAMFCIQWDSLGVDGFPMKFKKRRSIPLVCIRKFILGQYTPVFKRQPFPDDTQFDRSFSLTYVAKPEDIFVDYDVLGRKENVNRLKSMDIIMPSKPFRDNFVQLLSSLLEQVHDELEVVYSRVASVTSEKIKEKVLLVKEVKRVTPEYGEPLAIDKLPDVSLLDENEFSFCSRNHVFPSQYLRLKQRFVRLASRGRPPPETEFVAMGVLDGLRTAKAYAFLCNFCMPK